MEERDVMGLRFVAIKSVNQADVVVSVSVGEPEFLKTIRLNLYREDQPDTVVHSVKLDQSPLVFLPVLPMDGRHYFLQLDSTLGHHSYDYSTSEVSFSANASVQHLRLQFNPRRKVVESHETTQVSIHSILFVVLFSLAVYYHEALSVHISRLAAVVTANLLKPTRDNASARDPAGSSGSPNNVVFSEQELALMEPTVVKKKTKPRRAP